jgi:hypothetical protein
LDKYVVDVVLGRPRLTTPLTPRFPHVSETAGCFQKGGGKQSGIKGRNEASASFRVVVDNGGHTW